MVPFPRSLYIITVIKLMMNITAFQIKETRKSVHDSESGTRKLAIGHHLGKPTYSVCVCIYIYICWLLLSNQIFIGKLPAAEWV